MIARDGQWLYQGKPIGRDAIVKLFSTILRQESDGHHYLVTPVEKWRITVEDTAILAHSLEVSGSGKDQVLSVTTNTGETLLVGDEHPLHIGVYEGTNDRRPAIGLRHCGEEGLVTAAYYDLADGVSEGRSGENIVRGGWGRGKF